jgi:hypothetical protein
MSPESLRVRVARLERRVEILEQLPERVSALESQIVLLRDEMRSEFSATRAMSRQGDDTVVKSLREEIRESNENTVRMLREEIRAGDEETRRYMRVLHEAVIQRIATLGEGRNR